MKVELLQPNLFYFSNFYPNEFYVCIHIYVLVDTCAVWMRQKN